MGERQKGVEMSNGSWFMYYTMYLNSQQVLKQTEQKRKEAEEELLKAKAEARQAQEQLEQTQSAQPPVEEAKKETVGASETSRTSEAPTTTANVPLTTTNSNPLPRTDCEYLYEVGTTDYATCENTRMLVQQHNSNVAAIMLSTIAIGAVLGAFIAHHIERKVNSEYNGRSKSIYM